MDGFLSFVRWIDHGVAVVASLEGELTTFTASSLLAPLYTSAMCMYACMCLNIYIYIYIYIHTHTHKYIHTYMRERRNVGIT